MKANKNITISIDIIFVNRIPFFAKISLNIKSITIKCISNRTLKQILVRWLPPGQYIPRVYLYWDLPNARGIWTQARKTDKNEDRAEYLFIKWACSWYWAPDSRHKWDIKVTMPHSSIKTCTQGYTSFYVDELYTVPQNIYTKSRIFHTI